MRLWLALCLAAIALFLAAWMFIPAPTYLLLTFSVGAPEVSLWIVLGALASIAIALVDVRQSLLARIAAAMGGVALLLAVTPMVRFPGTARAFAATMRDMSAEPESPARSAPLVLRDLLFGIDRGTARVTRGVPFAKPGGKQLTLDVYQPTRRGHFPVLVQIYGGAWQGGQPADNANFATLLASHGWVVFAIDYRHAPSVRWPALLDDVDSSLVWIRDYAAEYDGDATRVVLMGRSAGAHLAMVAAYRHPVLNVHGVVSYYGPADLADAYSHPPSPDPLHIRSVEETLIGGAPDQMPTAYADASPVTYATTALPPTLLVYGRRDHIVEPRYGAQLRDRLAASGTRVAYLEIPWADHAFDAVFNGISSQLALYHTERFLAWAVR